MFNILVAATAFKVLLFPAYYSTDFEVHRNWLAITKNLPLDLWYYEDRSIWTLDYPPFFAWFEWVMSHCAPQWAIDDGALDLVANGRFGWPTIVFQRSTVIITELVLFASLYCYVYSTGPRERKQKIAIALSIAFSPGLLIIDHIHFQYNGFLYGLLIFSIVLAQQQRLLASGAVFAALLCFKHIYLYLAPAYFVYLLRAYILKDNRINWVNGIKLGSVVIGVFALAFGPFYKDISQILTRLFPFSRGLTHAYWAPNMWAIYSFTDKILSIVYGKANTSGTRGLVGDVDFAILPNIQPILTFFLTLFYQVSALIPVLIKPTTDRFLGCMTLCGFASFLLGWHVHEKAILTVIFPMSFLALKDRRILRSFEPLVVAGYISLFPLIFTPGEAILKHLYTMLWFVMVLSAFDNLAQVRNIKRRVFILERATMIYLYGFVPLLVAVNGLPLVIPQFAAKFEFLQLMMISVYCSIGVVASWAGFSWLYFFDDELW